MFDVKKCGFLLGAVVTVLPARQALAQDPAGLANQAPATSGATEVAKEGFQAAAAPAESKDAATFKLSAGGFLSRGNTRTIAATLGADYFLRRGSSQLTALAAMNYGRAAPAAEEPSVVTVENYQGRVR